MLALCKLEYVDRDLDTNMLTYRQAQCLISGKSLSDITANLTKWYGNDITTYTITPLENVIPIPESDYDKILNDSWTYDQLETKLY
jgi:hypothetical protein